MKKRIILDTDIYNEIDDQFALSYVLKSKEELMLEAVTIAPFTKANYNTYNSVDKSYEIAKKIFNLCGEQNTSIIYKGANEYFTENPNQINEAVNKIIETALKNEKTYILSIGCITNIALAIKKEPKIIIKIEVIWLGSNFLFMKNNDFNFRQDPEAIKYIMSKNVNLTIIPTYPVSYGMIISKYEIDARIKGKNKLCDYFCSIFSDDFGKIKSRRPIWDISVVAYILHPDWFITMAISCPIIKKDSSFKLTKFRKKIKFVQKLDSNKIYDDLFEKIIK